MPILFHTTIRHTRSLSNYQKDFVPHTTAIGPSLQPLHIGLAEVYQHAYQPPRRCGTYFSRNNRHCSSHSGRSGHSSHAKAIHSTSLYMGGSFGFLDQPVLVQRSLHSWAVARDRVAHANQNQALNCLLIKANEFLTSTLLDTTTWVTPRRPVRTTSSRQWFNAAVRCPTITTMTTDS